MMPSPFLSFQPTSPVFSQFLNHDGALTYSTLFTVLMKLVRAKTATAGAVVYSRAMKISAQPAEERASRILGTVKKRIRMCGTPVVPIISEKVMKKTSIIGR